MVKQSGFEKKAEERRPMNAECLQKDELDFWEQQTRCGDEIDLKLARDLPDDTPDFILRIISDFEKNAAEFCFSEARGRVLDAGCGNGNLLFRTLEKDLNDELGTQYVGMDFSCNMLSRAKKRASGRQGVAFFQGSVTCLPFLDESFDWVASSGVLTCLPTQDAATQALLEFNRVLKPDGVLIVDFFNRISHYTLLRRHLFGEKINPPEYVSPSEFKNVLENAGFHVVAHRGFDFKPCQGYLFMSRWRPFIDPGYVQERFSSFLEDRIVPKKPILGLLGYRIYVKCVKKERLRRG